MKPRRLLAPLLGSVMLLSAPRSDAAWLNPGESGRLAQRQLCAVSLQWLDASPGATDDQLAQLEHDGRLVVLDPGTAVVDNGSMVWPPHPAVTRLIVRSGPHHGAKCLVVGPAPKVR